MFYFNIFIIITRFYYSLAVYTYIHYPIYSLYYPSWRLSSSLRDAIKISRIKIWKAKKKEKHGSIFHRLKERCDVNFSVLSKLSLFLFNNCTKYYIDISYSIIVYYNNSSLQFTITLWYLILISIFTMIISLRIPNTIFWNNVFHNMQHYLQH